MQCDKFSFPDGDRNTFCIDTIESSDAFSALFSNGTVYISGVFTDTGMSVEKFLRLVYLLRDADLPKTATDFYLLGCKPNKECTDEVVAKYSHTHALWKQGDTVVEGIFFFRDFRWFYCGMAMYESNFGKGQFCISLRDILPPRMLSISLFQTHPELLDKNLTNGEMVIQLFKILRAFTPEFASDDEARRKKSALALKLPETATANEINTELAVRILTGTNDKEVKKCGRLAVISDSVFAKMDGSVVPIGSQDLDSFKQLGWNAIQQTLIFTLRGTDDKEFYAYKRLLWENDISVAESAFYGESDSKFGSIPGIRAFVFPHKVSDGKEYYGALGHGSTFASEILFNGFLTNFPSNGPGPRDFREQAVASLADLVF